MTKVKKRFRVSSWHSARDVMGDLNSLIAMRADGDIDASDYEDILKGVKIATQLYGHQVREQAVRAMLKMPRDETAAAFLPAATEK
jgi:hypothetical protein